MVGLTVPSQPYHYEGKSTVGAGGTRPPGGLLEPVGVKTGWEPVLLFAAA